MIGCEMTKGSKLLVAFGIVYLLFAMSPARGAHVKDLPPPMRVHLQCMLKVLMHTPGVHRPRAGVEEFDGALHAFLEYRPNEKNRWTQPTRFDSNDIYKGRSDQFTAIVPGLMSKPDDELDNHVTAEVVKRWKNGCGVDALVLTV
jgi:hypothetical protein